MAIFNVEDGITVVATETNYELLDVKHPDMDKYAYTKQVEIRCGGGTVIELNCKKDVEDLIKAIKVQSKKCWG